MLNEPDFKPSNKLLNLWICLPQNTISIGNNKIPPLFGKPKNFIFNYIFVIALILIEIYTVYYLRERGVNYMLMLILAIVDFFIAIIPHLFEQKKLDFCASYINVHLYLNKIKLKYTKATSPENKILVEIIKDFKNKKTTINIISFIITSIIIGFSFWKFNIYYGIYKSTIWTNPAGRLVIVTCILGVITHLFSTKIVLLDILVNRKKKKEIQAKREGDGQFIYDNSFHMANIETQNLNSTPNFTNAEFNNQMLKKRLKAEDFNSFSQLEKDKCLILKSANQDNYFSATANFSEDAYIIYTQLLSDNNLNDIILRQSNTFEREIVASYGKERQLTQLI
jgi:hypothetical protein